MAYRTSARTSAKNAAVACASCGALARIALEDARLDDLRCARCGTEQPALRDAGDLSCAKIELTEVQGGSYEELRPLLADLGAPPEKTAAVRLSCDGLAADVSLSINSGAVMGVDLVVRASGLPPMRLVRETGEHADRKERGIVREVQTGDTPFDDAVYIETEAADADVLTVFASPAARAAAVLLLKDRSEIEIADSYVKLYVVKDGAAFDPAAIRRRLGLLRVLAGAPRPLVVEHVPVPPLVALTKTLTYVLGPIAILVAVIGCARYMTVSARPLVVGILAGLVLAALVAPVFTLLLRGRSTSHNDIFVCRVIAFVFLPVLAFGALLIWNGAMDTSPERVVDMPVLSTSVDNEDDGLFHVATVDDRNEGHSYSFRSSNLRVGKSKVRARLRSGALGWTWESGDAVALE